MTIHEIMEKEEFQHFKSFLIDRGALEAFMINSDDATINFYPRPENIIGIAFTWHSTPQGGRYWSDVKNEYIDILDSEELLESSQPTELDKYIENNSNIGRNGKKGHTIYLKHPTKSTMIYICDTAIDSKIKALVNNKIIILSDKVSNMLELDSIIYITTKKTPYIYYEYFDNTLWGTTTKGKRVEAKVGKLIKAIMPEYDDTKVSEMVDTFRIYGKPIYLDNICIEDNIEMIYNECHDDRGSIGGSCMQDCGSYYNVIEDMGVKIAVLFDDDILLGRALLWDMEDCDGTPYKVMDRIYYGKESVLNSFKAYAIQEGYYRKARQSNDDSCRYDFISPDGNEEKLTLYSKEAISIDGESYPYLDTFFNIDYESNCLTNSSDDKYSTSLRTTDGSDTDGEFVTAKMYCESCDENYDEEDMIGTANDGYICSDCIDNNYFCDPESGDYFHNEFGAYCVDTDKIHHIDDVYYCEFDDECYSDCDAMPHIVETIDTGTEMLADDAYYCIEDGEYYEDFDNIPKDEEEANED